ncbi:MAG TPA: LemA family protein [Allosphingosinicella sp.]|nr:LemA family protein [Allosphingosinicella sp.]
MPEQSFLQAIDWWGRLARAANFMLDHWWLWLVAGLALWIALKLRARHALIGMLDERADAAFGDIDALLVERRSLIDNLVEIVRAFATREHEVIRDVLTTRVEQLEAIAKGNVHADSQIAGVLQNLFTVSERYPELASAAHYSRLRDDLIRIEDRITAARRFYNLAVEELNGVRRAFPGNWLTRPSEPPREKFSLGERRSEYAEPVRISL